MTAPTPAPKAATMPALPALPPTQPNAAAPPVKDSFLSVIVEALTAGAKKQDASSATPAPASEKPAASYSATADSTTASLLLALLNQPLPTLIKLPFHKSSNRSAQPDPTLPPATPRNESQAARAPSKPAPAEAQDTPPLTATLPVKKPQTVPPKSGTSVAITSDRMSLSTKRNEIAGRTEQKLPVLAVAAVASANADGSAADSGAKTPLPFSWHELPSEQLAIIDLSSKAAAPVSHVAEISAAAPIRATTTATIDRLEQMVSREVLSFRQTGAQTLGVALKLDANTQLFLQLTTNNGLVQASVRCDRGHFAPDDSQWAQLQQSLARQNVELLPMSAGSNLNFEQPSNDQRRQQAALEEWPTATPAVPQPQSRKQQKEQTRSRKNWESWA